MNQSQHDKNIFQLNRRAFLKTSGHLVLGFSLMPLCFCTSEVQFAEAATGSAVPNNISGPKAIDSWIRLDASGHVSVLTGKMELGQGIRTALMQMAAEELDVDMKRMRIITADTGQTVDERYTAGSASIESSGNSIRNAAAEARKILLEMAAQKLNVPIANLLVDDGTIKVQGSKKFTSYWEILDGKRLEGEVTGKAALKNPSAYKLVGTSHPREDILAMATGMPVFVHDMRLPQMVHARILRPPIYGARLVNLQIEKINNLPGVLKVVKNGSFVGVIALQEYQAVKALNTMREIAVWDRKPISPPQKQLYQQMLLDGSKGEVVVDDPSFEGTFASSSIQHEAVYKRPYQMHASLGPSCAIALSENDLLTIWTHTQGVYPMRRTLSDLLAIPENQIRVIGVPGAGCYGHNGADDVAADAALLAIEMPGRPIRVQWMRDDEHQWEPYGSAMLLSLKAGVSANGKIIAWKADVWSDTHSTRPGGKAGNFIAARDLEKPFQFSPGGFSGGSVRNALPLYDFPAKQIVLHNYKGPLRTSALRSLGAYANIFALECFIDELAVKLREDPVDFRLRHLKDERAKEVINVLATKLEWRKRRLPEGTAMGIAFAQYKNEAAYLAVIAEVKADPASRNFRVIKLTSCIDAGQTINRDGIKNQTSGGMIQAASWTLLEQVTYDKDSITSNTWDSYPILRFTDVPDTEVIIIDRPEQEPLGAGEAAQGPTAAAIANALYYATGSRLRELPLTADKIDWQNVKFKV